MGRRIMAAVEAAADLELVGALDGLSSESSVEIAGRDVPLSNSVESPGPSGRPDVVIDFSNAEWTVELIPAAVNAGVRPVIGTSGLSDDAISDAERRVNEAGIGGVIAANFALGAVLMMHLANVAAPLSSTRSRSSSNTTTAKSTPRPAPPSRRHSRCALPETVISLDREAERHNVDGYDSRGAELGGASLPFRPFARPGRAPGDRLWRQQRDAHHPPRLDEPRLLHPRNPPRRPGCARS